MCRQRTPFADIIGFVPPDIFKHDLMKKAALETPTARFSSAATGSAEGFRSITLNFIETLTEHKLCDNFAVQDVSDQTLNIAKMKLDDSNLKPRRADYIEGPVEWHQSDLTIHFKPHLQQDPFLTTEEVTGTLTTQRDLTKSGHEYTKFLDQLAHVAGEIFAHQHRTHLFQVLIIQNYARFLYWDRGSIIASERFDYTVKQGSAILADFFWRFNHMDLESRGWDSSASRPASNDVKTFKTAVEKFVKDMSDPDSPQRKIAGAENTLDFHFAPYELDVLGHRLIVQRPLEVNNAPCGRATRAYLAYSLKLRKLVFFKDSWRYHIKGLRPEAEVYCTLNDAGVPYIPVVLGAGDVMDSKGQPQVTVTHAWANPTETPPWFICGCYVQKYTHHRVLQELAYHVSTVMNSREYTMAFRDVLEAMDRALKKANYIHRDISLDNVMLSAEGEGVLNDWDQASRVATGRQKSEHISRAGTWAYMSIALLGDPFKSHEPIDDLESVFWAFLEGALLYFAGSVGSLRPHTFDYRDITVKNGVSYAVGGTTKNDMLKFGTISTELALDCKPFTDLIHALSEQWATYYHAIAKHKRQPTPKLQEMKGALSRPSNWVEKLDVALLAEDWLDDDRVPERWLQQKGDEDLPKECEDDEDTESDDGADRRAPPSILLCLVDRAGSPDLDLRFSPTSAPIQATVKVSHKKRAISEVNDDINHGAASSLPTPSAKKTKRSPHIETGVSAREEPDIDDKFKCTIA